MNRLVRLTLRVAVLAAIIYAVTRLLDGIQVVENTGGTFGATGTYVWLAVLFAVVNSLVGPVVRLLSLPFIILTLGLFLLVVNAALLGLTASLSDRLTVDGFGTAVAGGFLIAVFSALAEVVLPLKAKKD